MFVGNKSGKTKMLNQMFLLLAEILYQLNLIMLLVLCSSEVVFGYRHIYVYLKYIYLLNKHRKINKLLLNKCNVFAV